jgi:glutathione S-transferase
MKTQGIPFEERDVETSATYAREMRAINPRGGVPTFQIDGQVLVGFDARQVTATTEREAERRRLQ